MISMMMLITNTIHSFSHPSFIHSFYIIVGEAVDPHLSPNGSSVAFVINDDLYVMHIQLSLVTPSSLSVLQTLSQSMYKAFTTTTSSTSSTNPITASTTINTTAIIIRLTWNGTKDGISCGLADFVAQEEMDR